MKRNRGRNRRPGNQNPNRHYESNGPDVKIRGSAQQIFEKYQQFARDAQSAGDRVAAESYLQHAEHYYRIMAATMPRMPVIENDADGDDDVDLDGEGSDGDDDYARPQQSQRQPERSGDRQNDRQFDRQNDRGPRQNNQNSGSNGQNGQNAQGQGQGQGQGRPRFDRDRQDRGDRPDRQDRPDRDRGPRPERGTERGDRQDRGERRDRPERGDRPERTEHVEAEAEVIETRVIVEHEDPLKVVGEAPEMPVAFVPMTPASDDGAEGERPGRRRRAPYRRRGETDGAEPGGNDDASGVLAIVSRRPVAPVVTAADEVEPEVDRTVE